MTLLEALSAGARPDVLRQEILDMAGSLLFSGDAAQKKIRTVFQSLKNRF